MMPQNSKTSEPTENQPVALDRSEAVNLARNLLEVRESLGVTAYGVRVLCESILKMDAELLKQQERARRAAAVDWQPIETAPKDGSFLVYMPTAEPHQRIQAAHWHPNINVIGHRFHFDLEPVTHWKPFPAEPGAANIAEPLTASGAEQPLKNYPNLQAFVAQGLADGFLVLQGAASEESWGRHD